MSIVVSCAYLTYLPYMYFFKTPALLNSKGFDMPLVLTTLQQPNQKCLPVLGTITPMNSSAMVYGSWVY